MTNISRQQGFTMIELMMVIMIIGMLGATALPQLLDFRSEGRIASVREILSAMRVAIKNQYPNVALRCGASISRRTTASGANLGMAVYFAMYSNDVTSEQGTFWELCTTAQVPNANDRKFLNIGNGERAHNYIGGVDQGAAGNFPVNALSNGALGSLNSVISGTNNASINPFGSYCAWLDFGIASGARVQWTFNADTDEIRAGTHTAGIDECNF